MSPAERKAFLAKVFGFKFLDGFLLIYPLYGVMFVDHGLTPWQVSVTLIAWSTTAFVLQIPAGVLADRYSRRWLLCGGQLARGLGFLIWLLFPTFWGFLIGLMLWAVKSALTNGPFEALVYDELREAGRAEDYAQVIGRAQGFFFAAILLSAAAASYAVRFGYPVSLVASVAASLVGAGVALLLPRARKTVRVGRTDYIGHLREGFAFAASHKVIPGVIIVLALSQAFGSGMEGFWPIFARQVGHTPSNIALFVAGIAASQGIGAAIAHRVRGAPDVAFSSLFLVIGIGLTAAAAIFQAWTIALICLIAGLFKVIDVNFDARLHDAIPTETRATLAAVRQFAGLTTMTVVLIVFGPLADQTSYRTAFMAVGATLVLIGVTRLILVRR